MLQPDIELANMRNPTNTNPLTADTHTMLHTQTREPFLPSSSPRDRPANTHTLCKHGRCFVLEPITNESMRYMCRCDCLDASYREKPMERAGKGREQASEAPACTENTASHALAQNPHNARTVPARCLHCFGAAPVRGMRAPVP